jgi:AcrR family transcriptional regulator
MADRDEAQGDGAREETTAARGPRGSYAKGVAKREEILEAALEVVATKGYRGASVREIADAVGLSQAGLLHYFGTKEELFVEILRVRDRLDRSIHLSENDPADQDLIGGYLSVIRHNADVPGVVHLYSQMAVEGADPAHPAHDYFLARGEELRRSMQPALHDMQRRGALTPGIPPETLARIIQAVSDGVQLQWLLDPEVDMAAVVEALLHALHGLPGASHPEKEMKA